MLWIETPTNPLMKVSRHRARSARSRAARGAIFVVDNTFMSPFFQKPLALGRGHRRALDHEVPERPLRQRGRRRGAS
ncbi:MAG: PLP-dependent aspartate aminotransferase family protein [Ignavibacteriales bacterium]|nr:PLP-dependent aspartate aminotransferase family protein [Ignavibacteriales bacterium]